MTVTNPFPLTTDDEPPSIFAADAFSFYGKPIPISIGVRAFKAVPLWTSGIKVKGEKKTTSVALGLGYRGGDPETVAGGIKVLRIWANDALIYDRKLDKDEAYEGKARGPISIFPISMRIYQGTETQQPDPTIIKYEGKDNTPAFRGMIYIVLTDFDLTRLAFDTLPVFKIEIADNSDSFNTIARYTKKNGNFEMYYHPLIFPDWARGRFTVWTKDDAVTYGMYDYVEISRYKLDPPIAGSNKKIIGSQGVRWKFYDVDRVLVWQDSGLDYNVQALLCDPVKGRVIATLGETGDDSGIIRGAGMLFFKPTVAAIGKQVSIDPVVVIWGGLFGGDFLQVVSTKWKGNKELGLEIVDTRSFGDGSINCCTPISKQRSDEINYEGVEFFWAGTTSGRLLICSVWHHTLSYDSSHRCKKIFTIYDFTTIEGLGTIGSANLYAMWVDGTDGNLVCFVQFTDGGGFPFERVIKLNVNKAFGRAKGWLRHLGILDPDDVTIMWVTDKVYSGYSGGGETPFAPPSQHQLQPWYTPDRGSYVAWQTNARYYCLDGASGYIFRYDFTFNNKDEDGGDHVVLTDTTTGLTDPAFDSVILNNINSFGSEDAIARFSPTKMFLNQGDPGKVSLVTLIKWLCYSAGYSDDQIFIDPAVDDQIIGAIITEKNTFYEILDQLQEVFGFDRYESGGVIIIRPKSPEEDADPQYEINGDDFFAAVDGDSGPDTDATYFSTIVRPDSDIPYKVTISYLDATIDYQVSSQSSKRTEFPVPAVRGGTEATFGVPVIMTASQALQRANEVLWRLQAEKLSSQFRLTQQFLDSEPSDFIRVTFGDQIYDMKMFEVTLNGDWSMSCAARTTGIRVDKTYFADDPISPQPGIPTPEYMVPIIVDVPGMYLTATKITYGMSTGPEDADDHWVGSTVYETTTGDNDQIGTFSSIPARGFIVVPFNPGDDEIVIQLAKSTRSTDFVDYTLDEALSGLGMLIVGSASRWEMMTYQTATLDPGDFAASAIITLSGLIRGFRGTGVNAATHGVGDDVILYYEEDYQPITAQIDEIGDVKTYKSARNLLILDDAPTLAYEITGIGQSPFAPGAFRAVYDDDDILFTWERRDRINVNDFEDGDDDVTNSEAFEKYRLLIYDNDGNIVRTVDELTDNFYTYTNANILADLGSVPTDIHASVCQKGSVIPYGAENNTELAIYV